MLWSPELSGRHRHRMEVPVEAGMVSVIAPPALPLPRGPRHPPTSGGEFLVRRLLRIAPGLGPRLRTAPSPRRGRGLAPPPGPPTRSRFGSPWDALPATAV